MKRTQAELPKIPARATQRQNDDIATYDWQEMSNLSLTDRDVPSLRYSPESEQSEVSFIAIDRVEGS